MAPFHKSLDLKSFLIITLLLSALAGAVLFSMYNKEVKALKETRHITDRLHTNLTTRAVALDLKDVFINLQFIANMVDVRSFMAEKETDTRKDIEQEFIRLCEFSKDYDQIRLLDKSGMEILRVNNNDGSPAAVPPNKLQDKGNRYYFKEAIVVEPGEIYVSPFDLNIENGEIEQPLKPMIRFATPVHSADGELMGLVILNYLGQEVLDSILNSQKQHDDFGSTMLLNNKGYWLLHPDRKKEWGFMYEEKQSLTFANTHPIIWKTVKNAITGQIKDDYATYTFSTIVLTPQEAACEKANRRVWKLVHMTPHATLEAATFALTRDYLIVYLALMLSILLGAALRAAHIKNREQARQAMKIAQESAEDANKAKSDFLARMSHEIRTPMNAVIGLSHLALKTQLTAKQRDYLTKISISANNLLGIINDILDFSKIEARRLDIEETNFILDDVLNNTMSMFALQAEQQDIELLLMVESEVPNLLLGDPLRLGQVLMNLTSNAIKFTQHGEVIVAAELVEQDESTVSIRFCVTDTGIGIDKDKIDSLFEPFTQADGSTTRKYGGTGLGLVISKRLVELMGGTLNVRSTPGQGSRFDFTIPYKLQPDSSHEAQFDPGAIRGMRVLVIDDSKMSRMILTKVLESFTCVVDTAEDGSSALQAIESNDDKSPYKLIITDWRMPDMDGYELTRRIKRHSTLKNIPKIIMVTAYGHGSMHYQMEHSQLDGFMLKPINRSILFDTIMDTFAEGGGVSRGNRHPFKEQALPPNISGTQILLVEDNAINQQIANELLEDAGVNVTIANNGLEALNKLEEQTFDAVLMDIQMPEMDGLQAVRIIRSKPEFDSLPVISMTAHALEKDREKSLEAGMNDHITKPIDPNHLMKVLSQWLPERSVVPEDAFPVDPAPNKDEDASLPKLEGIDTQAGLSRVRGNEELYRKLLVNFAMESNSIFERILKTINGNSPENALVDIHQLKGTAGNLGARKLHAVLGKMEVTLETGGPLREELISEYRAEKKSIINSILSAFPQKESTSASTTEESPEFVKELLPQLEELHALLKRHDMRARTLFAEIRNDLDRNAPDLATTLATSLDRFDFGQAISALGDFLHGKRDSEVNNG